ncbi:hypothetical protein BTA51_07075 [Hahella sp. CCB-MM4]|uniref:hypothetical protein n=1 Tax=Hahella sp. (strain CCB-MM4) TaxID=1926491 RepID=UPI000B9AA86F|nr:hypothetical protein [Hahella sp. CCB-MM4]OZG74728.1 hypothetical protein BTA51_07075 [Hahella sp. CCB-MM4]
MHTLRYILAVGLFFLSCYLVFDLVVHGFNVFVLIGVIVGFLLAHFIKPKNSEGYDSDIIDILDFIIDMPFKAIALALRSLGSFFGRGGLDLD